MLKHNVQVANADAVTSVLSPSGEAALANLAEQMADELRQRGAVDVEAWQGRYPHFASEIVRLVPTLAALVEFSSAGGSSPLGELEESFPNKTLGDFRIIRELGRGGMGIVYDAEQISLGRHVALKILPTAAVLDPRTLQRFKNEAQAAAALDHPHIVDVYGVGSERAVHYYAMRLIDGCTLEDVVQELRVVAGLDEKGSGFRVRGSGGNEEESKVQSPRSKVGGHSVDTHPIAGLSTFTTQKSLRSPAFFCSIAELGIHVAEGLAHAHEQGIIHRDIKPSNLMLDAHGKVWITDFGLAQIETNHSLTHTGDLLGTLRYMSPEQTLASRAPIDHRSDIYSLGATLYELLTLRPVFAGDERAALIQRIALSQPTPPRRLNPQIPPDLETIILTMLEKDAASRYASAADIGAELRRFVENKPITARRPSWGHHLVKWSARNRGLVGGIGLTVLLVAAMAGGILGWWSRDSAAQRLIAERVASAAVESADRYRQERKWAEALTELQRAKAALSARPPDDALLHRIDQRAKDAAMVLRLDEIRLLAATLVGSNFDFQAADGAYRTAFKEYGIPVADLAHGEAVAALAAHSLREQLADALTNWAIVRQRRGDASGQQLLAVAQAADPDPWRNRLRQVYATRRLTREQLRELVLAAPVESLPPATLFLLVQAAGNFERSDEEVQARLREVQRLQAGDFWINFALARFFEVQQPPQHDEVVRYYSVALGIRPGAAAGHSNLGTALHQQGKRREAIAEFQLAIAAEPDFCVPYSNLGYALCEEKRYDEAVKTLRKAIELCGDLAPFHQILAVALEGQGNLDDAIAEYRKTLELDPANIAAHDNLRLCQARRDAAAETEAARP